MRNAKSNAATQERERLGLLDDTRVAAIIGVSVPTLRNRRTAGKAPPSAKCGRAHLTSEVDLIKWLQRRTTNNGRQL